MGCHINITRDKFPKQSNLVGKRAEVCFHFNSKDTVLGTIVRDDLEAPGETIIKLTDGRYVRGVECQYDPFIDVKPYKLEKYPPTLTHEEDMTQIVFECPAYCEDCPIAEWTVETNKLFTERGLLRTENTLHCRHEDACKKWAGRSWTEKE